MTRRMWPLVLGGCHEMPPEDEPCDWADYGFETGEELERVYLPLPEECVDAHRAEVDGLGSEVFSDDESVAAAFACPKGFESGLDFSVERVATVVIGDSEGTEEELRALRVQGDTLVVAVESWAHDGEVAPTETYRRFNFVVPAAVETIEFATCRH